MAACGEEHGAGRDCLCALSYGVLDSGYVFWSYLENFESFMNGFNGILLWERNRKLEKVRETLGKIPRRMLWYYGIDRLVLTQN